jgi:hypothetical protein
MSGYPPLLLALLQGLIAGAAVCVPPLAMAFGGRLKVFASDAAMIVAVLLWGGLVTTAVFLPFEGDWADRAFGPLMLFRPLIVGGSVVLLGTVVTQWRGLSRLRPAQALQRLGVTFAIGAIWGVLWGLSGWFLDSIGMMSNG